MREGNRKYVLVIFLGCCVLLIFLFSMQILHQRRMNKIFEQYRKEIIKTSNHV
jgi:hypothetical protein